MWLPNPRALSSRFHRGGEPGSLYLSIAGISLGSIFPLENILLSSSVVHLLFTTSWTSLFSPHQSGLDGENVRRFHPDWLVFSPQIFCCWLHKKKWTVVLSGQQFQAYVSPGNFGHWALVLDFAVFQFFSMERWWQVMPGGWVSRVWIPWSKSLFRSPCKWNGLK